MPGQTYLLDSQQSLGELSIIEAPGTYWINIDRDEDANRFCLSFLSALPENTKAALICSSQNPQTLVESLQDSHIKKLPLFSLPEKKSAIIELTSDLTRSIPVTNKLFVLMVHTNVWDKFNAEDLQNWLQKTQKWLTIRQSTLLIISHGPGNNTLSHKLLLQFRYLEGLTQLKWQQDVSEYIISWWDAPSGLIANQSLTLTKTTNYWTIQPVDYLPKPAIIHNDDFIYHLNQDILEGQNPLTNNWHVHESNQQLTDLAKNLQSATVVFALYNADEIETVARQIHQLRLQCGKLLKIVVREMSHSIRSNDELVFFICGANLSVPYAVTLSRFYVMLESIQGQQFIHHVPADIEDLLKGMQPILLKGIISPEVFAKAVTERVNNMLLPEDCKGMLVELIPKSSIKAEQALSICDMQRLGDIVTSCNNKLYLFFSICNIGDLEATLHFIFRIQFYDIFAEKIVWERDVDILDAINQFDLKTTGTTKDNAGSLDVKRRAQADEEVANRRSPISITLDTKEIG